MEDILSIILATPPVKSHWSPQLYNIHQMFWLADCVILCIFTSITIEKQEAFALQLLDLGLTSKIIVILKCYLNNSINQSFILEEYGLDKKINEWKKKINI